MPDMRYAQVETAGDARRWDTYIVPLPPDWDDDAEDRDARLRALIAEGAGTHTSTQHDDATPEEFTINEVTPVPAQEWANHE